MGISSTQYRDIMFQYDQTRTRNQRRLDDRCEELYRKFPELKQIHDMLVEISVSQARLELLNPEQAKAKTKEYAKKCRILSARKEEILLENNYPADYLNPLYQCKDCKDTGYIAGSPCHCLTRAKLTILYENSNLNDILETENFSHFQEEYYDDSSVDGNLSLTPRENIRRVKKICLDFVRHFDETHENLLFYGPTGVGKTFLTHCIAKELLDTSHTVVYLTSLQLFDILEKNKFQKKEFTETNEQISYILASDLLIIDDLGTELSNAFTSSQLYYIIEERRINHHSTIISTNLSFSDIQERYSERILSRFIGYYDFKQIIGEDIRIQKVIKRPHI